MMVMCHSNFAFAETNTQLEQDENEQSLVASETVYYQVPEEQYESEINVQVLKELETAILEDSGYNNNFKVKLPMECYNSTSLVKTNSSNAINYIGEVELIKNNLITYAADTPEANGGGSTTQYEYRTYLHEDKAKLQAGPYKYASNQLEGGYKGAKTLYYDPSGGGTYSIDISFPLPWGGVSVNASRGIGSNKDIGMNVPTTSTKDFNKVQAKKTYKGTPYSLQKRKKGTKKWTTFKSGVATKYYRVAARCVKVK